MVNSKTKQERRNITKEGLHTETRDWLLCHAKCPAITRWQTATIALGAAAAVGASAFMFTEFETLLELVGSVAALQIFINKFLFAEDRDKTVASIKTWLDTKVMPKDLAADIKGIVSSAVEDTGLVASGGEKEGEKEGEQVELSNTTIACSS